MKEFSLNLRLITIYIYIYIYIYIRMLNFDTYIGLTK